MYIIQLLFTENTVSAHYNEQSIAVYYDNQMIPTPTHTHLHSNSLCGHNSEILNVVKTVVLKITTALEA